MIKIYRKTTTINAEQFDPENGVIPEGIFDKEFEHTTLGMIKQMKNATLTGEPVHNWHVETLEGDLEVQSGDWIATGINGEHWVIADDVFKKTYAELPVIPKNVAKYIKHRKSSRCNIWDAMHDFFREDKVDEYMEDNSETFARAWLDGYVAEEDK